jgi:hypothetical protein
MTLVNWRSPRRDFRFGAFCTSSLVSFKGRQPSPEMMMPQLRRFEHIDRRHVGCGHPRRM